MNRNIARAFAAALLVLPIACSQSETPSSKQPSEKDESNAVDELAQATRVLGEMTQGDDIPMAQRNRARCVVVVPAMVSGGLLLGGSYGGGVVSCRTSSGWSGPAFIKMGGGSAGLQAGVQSSDLVMLATSDGAVSKLFSKGFELGAGASVAAGPIGTGAKAATDVQMRAEILTYARSRGLFAGVNVSGMGVKRNDALNAALYGRNATTKAILEGRLPAPPEAGRFLSQLARSFPKRSSPAVSLAR